MVFLVETTICGTKTFFSEAEPIFYASETGFSTTEKTVGEVSAVFVQPPNKSSKGGIYGSSCQLAECFNWSRGAVLRFIETLSQNSMIMRVGHLAGQEERNGVGPEQSYYPYADPVIIGI
jgi:hypothetical protein